MVFDYKRLTASDVFERAMSQLQTYRQLSNTDRESPQTTDSFRAKWEPPAAGNYKVNVDGAFDHGKAGVGVLIRDSEGEIIAAMACPQQQINEP